MDKSFEKIITEKAMIMATYSISALDREKLPSNLKFISEYDACTRRMLLMLSAYMESIPAERISIHRKYPRTWWDAFKIRWFPAILLQRFPPEYERIDIDELRYAAVCPHLKSDPERFHTTWLLCSHDRTLQNGTP